MRVKRLEIQGFKSFKDKTVIHFDHRITGIVGPNGCGKSNIVDAFFWVMGEQSYKHMRGQSSDDLIFNGSSKYSALGYAEATLVLETQVPDPENAPSGATAQDIPLPLKSKEISVTRRLYREGEGEYLINGAPSRLKDIHELFMDTGVGAKGYSVIEQGQIGKIVNSKPEERRLLIEEAAGIAKYKARKRESLRKMEAAESNLSRLGDVIQEIERNLGTLERQAQKARLYKKYKDELLEKEVTWGRRRKNLIEAKIDALKKQHEALDQEWVGLRAELQVSENQVEIERAGQIGDTQEAEQLQTDIQALSEELAGARSALDLSKKRQDDLEARLRALEQERVNLAASIEAEIQSLATLELQEKESAGNLEQLTARIQTEDTSVALIRGEHASSTAEIDALRRNQVALLEKRSAQQSEAAALQSQIRSSQERVEHLQSQKQELEAQTQEAQSVQAQAREALGRIEHSREELAAREESMSRSLQEWESRAREQARQRDEAHLRATQLRSKLDHALELIQSHEAFADGPKAALDWARQKGCSERLIALADCFDVEPGYELIAQTALSNRLESLVLEDARLGLELVDALASSKQGRVDLFLNLSRVESEGPPEAYLPTLEGAGFEVLGRLSSKVRVRAGVSSSIRDWMENWAEGVVLVKSLEPLAALSSAAFEGATSWPAVMVSLDGKAWVRTWDAAGCLRGGISEQDTGTRILQQRSQARDLEQRWQVAQDHLESLSKALESLHAEITFNEEKLSALQSDLQAVELQKVGAERDALQADRRLQELAQQLKRTAEEQATLESRIAPLKERQGILEAEIAEHESQGRSCQQQLEELTRDATGKALVLKEREEALQLLRIDGASLRERLSSLTREAQSLRSLLESRRKRFAEVFSELETINSERTQFMGGDSGHESRILAVTERLAQSRSSLAQAKERLSLSGQRLNQALDRIKSLHQGSDEKSAALNQCSLEREKQTSELAYLIQNLEEKYGAGCLDQNAEAPLVAHQEEMDAPIVTLEMSAEEEAQLSEEVERLRERIRRLGEVNVFAIDEFEETQKRFEYLQTERADLQRSISDLNEAIEHINKTSEERFKKAFEAISERFSKLFPAVFGGGMAELSLVYPEGSQDILDAGIDILAQPPGKKVSNITLLSGGEKALTAISLIFAIFMVKPSPFCVLDEVDAPLDDANIGKFNTLLREMASKSQFILITHNKKTMELNDTLYGVTMEEPGVSKMVSIEMN